MTPETIKPEVRNYSVREYANIRRCLLDETIRESQGIHKTSNSNVYYVNQNESLITGILLTHPQSNYIEIVAEESSRRVIFSTIEKMAHDHTLAETVGATA